MQISTLAQEKEKIALELKQKTEEPSELTPQLTELQETIQQLDAQIISHQTELEAAAEKLKSTPSVPDPKPAELEKTIQQLNAKISSLEAEIAEPKGQDRKDKEKLHKANSLLKKEQDASRELSTKLLALEKEHAKVSAERNEFETKCSEIYINSSLISKENTELKEQNEQFQAAFQEIAAQGLEEENQSFQENASSGGINKRRNSAAF